MNVKELVESIPTYNPTRNTSMVSCDYVDGEFVSKSDFDRVVEELTKWNKVDDGLNFRNEDEMILCRNKHGDMRVIVARHVKNWALGFIIDGITDWRYIY